MFVLVYVVAAALIMTSAVAGSYALIAIRNERVESQKALDNLVIREATDKEVKEQSKPNGRLANAGIDVAPTLWYGGCVGASILFGAVFMSFIGNPLAFILGPVLIAVVEVVLVGKMTKKQKALFDDQFCRACGQIASGIKSGLSIERAIRSQAEFANEPLRSEFQKVVAQVAYNPNVSEALYNMAKRTESRDVMMFADAIDLNQRRGGKLASTMDTIAETIKRRQEMQRHIEAESASCKASAKAVVIISILLVLFQVSTDETCKAFYSQPESLLVAIPCAVVFALGGFILKKMADVDTE